VCHETPSKLMKHLGICSADKILRILMKLHVTGIRPPHPQFSKQRNRKTDRRLQRDHSAPFHSVRFCESLSGKGLQVARIFFWSSKLPTARFLLQTSYNCARWRAEGWVGSHKTAESCLWAENRSVGQVTQNCNDGIAMKNPDNT